MKEEELSYVRPWKARPLRLRGKGFFRGWSSEVSYGLILYQPTKDTIKVLKRWPQQAIGNPNWVYPHFPKKTKEKFLSWAREAYLNRYKRHKRSRQRRKLVGHREDLCKMCEELGHRCVGGEDQCISHSFL